ncbi:DUF4199 domain-containing protein [Moheibacter sediminis]|uniref:DUF4199 domain-containing protein n=1 Tax=Moheibacter sediminis TaxID=1434700 RepID=A0A1W1Z2M8_9FLAO|nr:DUF4199 domain-containing protein [Moheibacter sediminis]SMC42679.1 Protein of unknown function [Moheibacter sediminis]
MNYTRLTLKLGGILFFVTIALFLILYFVFSTQGSISEADYFNYSSLINCFVMPALYAGIGFYSAFSAAKQQALKFGQGFRKAFIPQFIGGLLSLAFIFIFFNTVGSWAEDSLQRGWYSLIETNPNQEFMEKNGEFVAGMKDLNYNMFTFRTFTIAFMTVLFFYVMISTIFAVFLKNRKM